MITKEQRFWTKVRKTKGCWYWVAAKMKNGYGSFDGMNAHRFSWILSHGLVPKDRRCVCHKCDNRLCVRPSHLFVGTHKDNMVDASKKGRLTWKRSHKFRIDPSSIPRGNTRKQSKLNPTKVKEIRRLREQGGTLRGIASSFGVTSAAIYRVVIRKAWSHVR